MGERQRGRGGRVPATRQARAAERGFTLIEVLVAMAVLTIALLGVARLAAEGVRSIAEATRLERTLEVIEDVSATGRGGGAPGGAAGGAIGGAPRAVTRGCEVRVSGVVAAISWRWIEARCRRAEAAAGAGAGGEVDASRGVAAGDREVGRLVLVPS